MRMTKREINAHNSKLIDRGAWLAYSHPGDGLECYRLLDAKEWATRHGGTLSDIRAGNIPEPDYSKGAIIQRAIGTREARLMVETYITAYDAGWNDGYSAHKMIQEELEKSKRGRQKNDA